MPKKPISIKAQAPVRKHISERKKIDLKKLREMIKKMNADSDSDSDFSGTDSE